MNLNNIKKRWLEQKHIEKGDNMSKLYLHKINDGKINTRKSTIVADLSKYTYSTGTRVYKYQNTYFLRPY